MNNHVTAAPRISFLATASLAVLTLFITACSSNDSNTPTYTVGGSVTGTSGTGLVLQLNAANNLTIAADGTYTFTPALTSGASYAVTVLSAPTGQTCRVTNGSGSGSIGSASVSNVGVECRTNADPNGYYTNTGSATVGDSLTTNDIVITDFQAIVQDNRFMAMSVANRLVYDGPLEMFGVEFTATVSVYRDGVMIYSDVSVSGTVIEGASITGTLAGTEEGAGSFGLAYATTNTGDADVARIDVDMANPTWASTLGNSTTATEFDISSSAEVYGYGGISDGNFQGCFIYTVSGGSPVAVIPVSSSRLYRVTVQLAYCTNTGPNTIADSAGHYTGFATSRMDSATPDDTLVFMVTSANGQYTASGDFK